jgi:hypothetical protein
MKKFIYLFILFSLFFISTSNSQTIADSTGGKNLFEIKDGVLKDLTTGESIYKFTKNIIKSDKTGKNLYKVIDGVLIDYSTGKSLYEFKDNIVVIISSGKKICEITDSGLIKSWSMGQNCYQFIQNPGAGQLYMVLLAIGLL